MQNLAEQAQAIANQYLSEGLALRTDYAGRLSELANAHTLNKLFNAIADGNYVSTATRLAGISHDTYTRWLKRGEAEPGSAYALFAEAVKEAECEAEASIVADIRKAARKDAFWAAGMTLLERKNPDRWGKRQDDQQVPRVVVQIGVAQGEVKVGLAIGSNNTDLSPANINDLACGNHSQVEMLSPINRDYVNESKTLPALVSTTDGEAIGDSLRSNPEGDPTPVGRALGGQRRRLLVKGRSAPKQRKRVVRSE